MERVECFGLAQDQVNWKSVHVALDVPQTDAWSSPYLQQILLPEKNVKGRGLFLYISVVILWGNVLS